jgi:hypothetical protein
VLLREGGKVVGDIRAVRAITPDVTRRPYYLASIATSAESNNVANSGESLVRRVCSTHGLTRLRESVWTGEPGGLGHSGESGSPGSRWGARARCQARRAGLGVQPQGRAGGTF